LLLSGCFSQWQDDKGFFTVHFGSPSSNRSVPEIIDQLVFTITVSDGPGADHIRYNISSFDVSQRFSVEPGNWTITIEAYFEEKPFANGSKTVSIQPGPNGTVEIEMVLIKPDEPDDPVEADFIIRIEQLEDGTPVLTVDQPISIYQSGEPVLIAISGSAYSSINWYYNEIHLGSGNQLTLNPHHYTIGIKLLTIEVEKDDIPYSRTIEFEILPDETIAADFFLTIEHPVDGTPALTSSEAIILYHSWNPVTLSITNSSLFTRIEWYYNNILLGSGPSLTLNPADYTIGIKLLTVEVLMDGVPYNLTIEFEVEWGLGNEE